MKTYFGFFLTVLSFSAIVPLQAATTAADQSKEAPTPTPYGVTTRDANSQVWERIVYELDPLGQAVSKKHSYTEMATGLNYKKDGQWVASKEWIDILPNGTAAAIQGQHQAYFPGDIYQGQIELVTPDGQHLKSRPLGLSYFDGENTVLIAELTNSIGVVAGSNVVIYPNAFTDIKADLRYTYTKAGFEQDVILRQQPPTPESFSLNPDNARLQVMTEFFSPPQPIVQSRQLPAQAGVALTDESLGFGAMRMVPGKAFLLGKEARNITVKVAKRWVQVSGRQFLVEEVPVDAIADGLAKLPLTGMGAGSSKNSHTASRHPVLPTQRLASENNGKAMMLAKSEPSTSGLVLDYQTINASMTNFIFRGDTTYFNSGTFYLYGATTFEGGAIIKQSNAEMFIDETGTINCLTAPYKPAVFTSMNDDSIGESITGSNGHPSGMENNFGLTINIPTATIHDMRFIHIDTCLNDDVASSTSLEVRNCQFIDTDQAVVSMGNLGLYNVLISQWAGADPALVAINATNLTCENVTDDGGSYLIDFYGNPAVNLTNCLFTGPGILNPYGSGTPVLATNAVVCLPSPATLVYQMAGGGSYYLATNSPHRNAGTTNIDSGLLAALKQRTTYPPIVYSNQTISVATTLSPQAQRDTDTPDLGYHYDPIDYVFGGVHVVGNLTVDAGTALGWFEVPGSFSGNAYGIALTNDVSATFNGTVTKPDFFVQMNSVQEGGNGVWAEHGGWPGGLVNGGTYDPYHPAVLTAYFTLFGHLSSDSSTFRDGASGQPIKFRFTDCQILGDCGGYNFLGAMTNCFILGVFSQSTADSQYAFETNSYRENFQNCTFHNGLLQFNHWESPPYWQARIQDCSFDGTAMDLPTDGLVCDYNAFLTNTDQLPISGAHDVVVTNYNWQSSWLGSFYLPSDSPLVNAGSTTADQLGLYHFTTQTNQVKEASSRVDIGYHYVATDAYGTPLDTNGDGIADYLEDANGNGLVDAGEINWDSVGNSGFKVLISRPKNNSVLP